MNANDLFMASLGFIFGTCFMAVGALWAYDRTKNNNPPADFECFDYEVPANCTAETMADAVDGKVMCLSLKGTL